MGVSNVFGSNVFDFLIGLAVPWFLKAISSTGYVTKNLLFKVN
jgi:Ca2+/Na+ antiporter